MTFLCKLGIHKYKFTFIGYGDYGLCSPEDDLCGEEGRYTNKCQRCGKEKKLGF